MWSLSRHFFADSIMRPMFVLWAKTSKAPGWLYQVVEKYGNLFTHTRHRRTMFNGASFICDLTDHVQQKIYFFGAYEPLELHTLLSLLKPGDIIIDAGANVGAYSLPIAKHKGGICEVHAFEPIPDNFSFLLKNYVFSGSPKNLFLNPLALWNKEEILEFHLSDHHRDNAGSFTMGKPVNSIKKITAKAITLDSYVQMHKLSRIDIIKMDIEGAEKFAIEGALEVIKKFRPKVFIEINAKACQQVGYTTNELVAPFLQNNYKIYGFGLSPTGGGWIENVEEITQANVILIPAEYDFEFLNYDIRKIKKSFLHYF